MENEAKEPAGVTRSQNAMYVLPHDAAAAQEFVAPLLQRVTTSDPALQLLVITTDAEAAASLAGTVVRNGDADLRVVPVAGARRAERRIREGAHVVIGGATELLGLVRAAALKLDALRAVCIAWADELTPADVDALEAVFGEIPRTAARVVVATEATDAVEALVEAHARRPRRSTGRPQGELPALDVGFVAAAPSGRAAALRRIIDAVDPRSARVVVRGDESERAARHALEAMGYRGGTSPVAVVHAESVGEDAVDLAVLYDLPHTAEQLAAGAASAARTIALVQPRQIASLRKLAAGGSVTPVVLPDVTRRAESEVAALREVLVGELAAGGIGRELLVLEPLLEDHDPMELAAAALRLATRTQAGAGQVRGGAAAAAPSGPMARVFINVGEMDNARPGDIAGAIINEGGVQRDQLGRIDVRDKHTVVEVAAGAAEQVIERLSGSSIRGRRVQARLDQERPARDRGERAPRGDRPERGAGRDRAARAPRERSFDRERPARERSFDRERPARERSFDRERPARERSFDRERPARTFDRERPARERSFDRDRPARGPRAAGGSRDREGGFGGRQGGSRGPAGPRRPRRDDA